jgi:ribulose-bisphosphate carboxylase small chain
MTEIQDFDSGAADAQPKLETFSYLPPMTAPEIRRQVAYIVARGWNPGIEHSDPARTRSAYWQLWKLPMFGETNVDRILAEVGACREANPGHYVRLLGFDNVRQTQGTAMVICRAP